jgi:hypothetical protein
MAVTISGLVIFVALYHYFKISMSWNEAKFANGVHLILGGLIPIGLPFVFFSKRSIRIH